MDELISPVARYLGTNYVPSEQELIAIQEYIVQQKTKLKDLKLQIRVLETDTDSETQNLKLRHDSLMEDIAEHQALTKLVRRIPADILSEIFLATVGTRAVELFPSMLQPLFDLLRVCRWWNQVAMSTPGLWTKLRFSRIDVAKRITTIQVWLSRSGSLPLTLSLYEALVNDDFWDEMSSADCISRIGSLSLNGFTIARPFFAFPSLRFLDLAGPILPLEILDYTPRLQYLWVNYSGSDPILRELRTRFRNLVTLYLRTSTQSLPLEDAVILELLDGCTSLRMLELAYDTSINLPSSDPAPMTTGTLPWNYGKRIDLPSLHSMRLEGLESTGRLLSQIIAPNLTHLDIHAPFSGVVHLLPSSPNIRVLALNVAHLSPGDIITALRAVPLLEEFIPKVRYYADVEEDEVISPLGNDLIHFMTPSFNPTSNTEPENNGSCLCPFLHTMDFSGLKFEFHLAISPTVLAEFVRLKYEFSLKSPQKISQVRRLVFPAWVRLTGRGYEAKLKRYVGPVAGLRVEENSIFGRYSWLYKMKGDVFGT